MLLGNLTSLHPWVRLAAALRLLLIDPKSILPLYFRIPCGYDNNDTLWKSEGIFWLRKHPYSWCSWPFWCGYLIIVYAWERLYSSFGLASVTLISNGLAAVAHYLCVHDVNSAKLHDDPHDMIT